MGCAYGKIWQWLRHGITVGTSVLTFARFSAVVAEESVTVTSELASSPFVKHLSRAQKLLLDASSAKVLPDFLTSLAYPDIVSRAPAAKL